MYYLEVCLATHFNTLHYINTNACNTFMCSSVNFWSLNLSFYIEILAQISRKMVDKIKESGCAYPQYRGLFRCNYTKSVRGRSAKCLCIQFIIPQSVKCLIKDKNPNILSEFLKTYFRKINLRDVMKLTLRQ
jgi:hypothetical protein